MIAFACAHCGKALSVKDELAGKKGKCPHCAGVVRVPRSPEADLAAAPPLSVGDLRTLPPVPVGGGEAPLPVLADNLRPGTKTVFPFPKGREHTEPSGTSPARPARDPERCPEGSFPFLAPAQAPDEMGRLGPYRVLKVLGSGGMGVVFLAQDVHLQRHVALKALLPTLASGPKARERFLREARAMAALKHDHVVTIYEVGADRGVPYLAMEFLEGETLETRLGRQGRLPAAEVLRIGREIALGLAAAHERGLIHRDVKPANVWLECRGQAAGVRDEAAFAAWGSAGAGPPSPLPPARVKILDFGLARSTGGETHLTREGVILGTPAYMAPEQAGGPAVDGRCDLFSLGCVLYRMATGELPFRGTDVLSTLLAVATHQPLPPGEWNPGLPRALSDLVMRLLAKSPRERPASAREVAEALAAIERAPGPTGPMTVPVAEVVLSRAKHKPRSRSRSGRRRVNHPGLWLGAVGMAAVGLVLLLAGVWLLRSRAREPVLARESLRGQGEAVPPAPVPGEKDGLRPEAAQAPPIPDAPAGPAEVAPPLPPPGPWKRDADPQVLKPLVGTPLCVAVSPDGSRVAVGGSHSLVLMDRDTGTVLKIMHEGKNGALIDSRVVFAPDGQALFGSDNNMFRLYSAGTGRSNHTFNFCKTRVRQLVYSPSGRFLLMAADDPRVVLWDVENKKLIHLENPGQEALGLGFGPGEKTVFAGGPNCVITFWETGRGRVVSHLAAGLLKTLSSSRDGSLVLTGGSSGVALWNTISGRPVRTLGEGKEAIAVALSADGRYAVGSGRDNTLRVWETADGREVRRITVAREATTLLGFTPDGRHVFAGVGTEVYFWNTLAPAGRDPPGP